MVSYRQPFTGDYPITQRYGELIPGVTYKDRPHTGIDYGCPEGTPILASADGIVQYSDFDKTGYGKMVIILHYDNQATLYAHLSSRNVVIMQKVKQGDVIGYSGNTGNSFGPHLHFEARHKWNDWKSHFDPMDLPLRNVIDMDKTDIQQVTELKDADAFNFGDLVKIVAPLGAKGFYSDSFQSYTTYNPGSMFFYTGESVVRKDNGLTYMRVVPATFSVLIAVHDEDTQIIDK